LIQKQHAIRLNKNDAFKKLQTLSYAQNEIEKESKNIIGGNIFVLFLVEDKYNFEKEAN
jgi:hypothetical protein